MSPKISNLEEKNMSLQNLFVFDIFVRNVSINAFRWRSDSHSHSSNLEDRMGCKKATKTLTVRDTEMKVIQGPSIWPASDYDL